MIFYFSGTGNSLHVAMAVRRRFGGVCVDMAKATADSEYTYTFEKGEAAVFVFPVYYGGLPYIVRDFIRDMDIQGETPEVVGIATCGTSPAACDRRFARAFGDKGITVRAFYDVKMPANYICLYDPPIREAALMTLKRSDERIRDVLDSMAYNHRKPYHSAIGAEVQTRAMQAAMGAMSSTRAFCVTDKCISCGQCQRICPTRSISMQDGRPIWTSPTCLKCTACINRCPAEAINYGKVTVKRHRYVHPDLHKLDQVALAKEGKISEEEVRQPASKVQAERASEAALRELEEEARKTAPAAAAAARLAEEKDKR